MSRGDHRGTGATLARIAITALAYVVVGRLSLFLAIPPGYATAVWPAAGIALALVLVWGTRVLPGIVIGSFFLNVPTSFDASSTDAIARSAALAASIGVGAALQAAAGAHLARARAGWPNLLARPGEVAAFLFWTGPVACVVSPTWGVSTLCGLGVLPWDNFAYSWATWCVGDTIGTVLFAPVLLLWIGPHAAESRTRRLSVALPLAGAFAALVLLFVLASGVEKRGIETEFGRRTDALASALTRGLDGYVDDLRVTQQFFAASGDVTRAQFAEFVTPLLTLHPGVQAIEWVPRVPAAERASYEAAARVDGIAGFRLTEKTPRGELVAAGDRDEYYPVYFVQPRARNESALGFDLASDALRLEALRASAASGEIVASEPTVLVQEKGRQSGFIVFAPIYDRNAPTTTPAERWAALRGFGLGAFRVRDVLDAILAGYDREGVEIRLDDPKVGDEKGHLYAVGQEPGRPTGITRAMPIAFAGRSWSLEFALAPSHLARHRPLQAWSVLAGGLALAALLGALLLVVTGRTVGIEMLVAQRTRDLAASRAEVEEKNRDLETLLQVFSHDFKEPLRAVEAFAEILGEDKAGNLDAEGREYLHHMAAAAARMRQLVNDLLTLSRARRLEPGVLSVSARQIVRDSLDRLARRIQEDRATVRVAADLPELRAEPTWATEAVYNLLSNAFKFTRNGAPPEVDVEAFRWHPGDPENVRGHVGIVVADRGPGVGSAHQEMIFDLFKRAPGRAVEGTGAGLAIVREIARRHDGWAWHRSREPLGDGVGGSEFVITFGPAPIPGEAREEVFERETVGV